MDLVPPPGASVDDISMNGLIAGEQVRRIEAMLGPAKMGRTLERIPGAERLRELTPVSEVPVRLLDELYVTVAEGEGQDVRMLQREIVYDSVASLLRGPWRAFVRVHSDEALAARAPRIYAGAMGRGALSAKVVRAGLAEVRVTEWSGMWPLRINGLETSLRCLLESCGRRHVHLESFTTLDGACCFARWV